MADAVLPLSTGWVETSDGEQPPSWIPIRPPLHPFDPITRLATLLSVKDVRFCQAETGAFTRSEEWPVAT